MTDLYELECVDCAFHATMVGEFSDVIEEANGHREEVEATPDAHFVNIHRRY